jgi:hypothetical protein
MANVANVLPVSDVPYQNFFIGVYLDFAWSTLFPDLEKQIGSYQTQLFQITANATSTLTIIGNTVVSEIYKRLGLTLYPALLHLIFFDYYETHLVGGATKFASLNKIPRVDWLVPNDGYVPRYNNITLGEAREPILKMEIKGLERRERPAIMLIVSPSVVGYTATEAGLTYNTPNV